MSFSTEDSVLRGQTPSPAPRAASTSLQAAAAVNAGLQHEGSRRRLAHLLRNESRVTLR
jgi:hypothetical protein